MEDDLKKNKKWKTTFKKRKWKMTSIIFLKLEWRPQKKWKTTSKKNGRRPQKKRKKRTMNNQKMEDDLKKIKIKDDLKKNGEIKWRRHQKKNLFLIPLFRENLSWDWLSSLRFFSTIIFIQLKAHVMQSMNHMHCALILHPKLHEYICTFPIAGTYN